MNNPSQLSENGAIAFYKQYVDRLNERIMEAHLIIGRLRYHLESNGIEVPGDIATQEPVRGSAVTKPNGIDIFSLN